MTGQWFRSYWFLGGWLMVGLVIAAYSGVVDNGLCLDDQGIVVKNRHVAEASWSQLWTTSYWQGVDGVRGGLYRPLTLSLLALERTVFGLRPGVFHAVSVVLQILAGFCLAWAVRRIGYSRSVCILAGALFCVHPAATEVVNSVVGSADLLVFLGGVSGAVLLVTARSTKAVILAPLLIGVATLAKESGAIFAVGAICVHLLHDRRPLPIVAAVAALVLPISLRVLVTGHISAGGIGFLDNPLVFVDQLTRWLNAPSIGLRYVKLLFFPWPLSADHSYDAIPVVTAPDVAAWLLPLALFVSMGRLGLGLLRHRVASRQLRYQSGLGPGTLWLAIGSAMLMLVSHTVIPLGTIYAERLAYPMLAGTSIAGALLLLHLRRTWGRAVCATVAVCWVLISVGHDRNRTQDWRDDGTLFAEARRVNPSSARAHYGWALHQQLTGDPAAALQGYQKALTIYPRYPDALHNQGAALVAVGRYGEAIQSYDAAARARPKYVRALFAAAAVREVLQDRQTLAAYRRVLDHEPRHVEAARGAARCLVALGDTVSARQLLTNVFGASRLVLEWNRLSAVAEPTSVGPMGR
jgi:hypothetical protein